MAFQKSRDSLGLHLELEDLAGGLKKFAAGYSKMANTVVRENSRIRRSLKNAFDPSTVQPASGPLSPISSGRARLDLEKLHGGGTLPTDLGKAYANVLNIRRAIEVLNAKGASGTLNPSGQNSLRTALRMSAIDAKRLNDEFAKLGRSAQSSVNKPIQNARLALRDAVKLGEKLVGVTRQAARGGGGGAGGGNVGAGSGGGGASGGGGGGNGPGGLMAGIGSILLGQLPSAVMRTVGGVAQATGYHGGVSTMLDTVDELNRILHRTRGELFGVRHELVMAGTQFGAVLNPTRIAEATQAVVEAGYRGTADIAANMKLVGLGAAATGASSSTVAGFARMLQMGGAGAGGAANLVASASRFGSLGGSSGSELMQTGMMAQEGMGAALTNLDAKSQQRAMSTLQGLQAAMTSQGISGAAASELVRKISVAVSDVTSPEARQIAMLTGLTGGDRGSLMAALKSGKGEAILRRIQGYGSRAGGNSSVMAIMARQAGIDSRSLSLLTKNGNTVSKAYKDMAKAVEGTGDAMQYLNEQGKNSQTTATSMFNAQGMKILAAGGMTAAGGMHEYNVGAIAGGTGNALMGLGQTGLALLALRGALGGRLGGLGKLGGLGRMGGWLGRLGMGGAGAAGAGGAGAMTVLAPLAALAATAFAVHRIGGAIGKRNAETRADDQMTLDPYGFSVDIGGRGGRKGLAGLYDSSQDLNPVAARARMNQSKLHHAMLTVYRQEHPDATFRDIDFGDTNFDTDASGQSLLFRAHQYMENQRNPGAAPAADDSAAAEAAFKALDKQDLTNALLQQILVKLSGSQLAELNAH